MSTIQIPWQNRHLSTQADKPQKPPARDSLIAKQDTEVRKACAEFESLFIFYLLKEMRETVPKSGLMGGGTGEDIYTSMLDSQMAREMSSKGGIGLSTILLDQLRGKRRLIDGNTLK
ncbi:MAG: rod-binding protein [Thermodesulfobacteriota bacterium]|nr:rod-binding protein [Thermodesulfobacteriota bacterium]